MPSIPQSLLWISLVVLWLFVLVPMLINKRDTVRRTSDIALSTRVLNTATRSRLLRRSGPAAGHRNDPDWRPDDSALDEDFEDYPAEDYDEAVRVAVQEAARGGSVRAQTDAGTDAGARTMMVVAALRESEANTEPVYIDVDVVDETSGALPVGGGVQEGLFEDPSLSGVTGEAVEPEVHTEAVAEAVAEADAEAADAGEADGDLQAGMSDDYEYVDDSSGLEAEDDPVVAPQSNRRRRLESSTAAAVSARKYRFRKRVLTALVSIMVLTAGLSFIVSAGLWWACGITAAVTLLYLGYLRRQVRIEEQIRRRRQQRMSRGRMGYDAAGQRFSGSDVDPAHLRRPGAVVLDIDDEDPIFEHLEEMPYSRRYDLPRAAGQ